VRSIALNTSKSLHTLRLRAKPYENPLLRESNTSQISDFGHKSALRQLVEDIKHDTSINVMQESPNVNLAQSLTMSANYDKMKQDLESLQEKIRNLETKLGSSTRFEEEKFLIQKREEKPLHVHELAIENSKENLMKGNELTKYESIEALGSNSKRSSKKRREKTLTQLRPEPTMSNKERSGTPGKSPKEIENDYKKLYEAVKSELAKEKKANKELKTKLKQYENLKQDKNLKDELEELKRAYEKSEELRKKQKEAISKLKKDIEKGKTAPITVTTKLKKKLTKRTTKSKLPKKVQ